VRTAHTILIKMPKRKLPFGELKLRYKDNIKSDHKEIPEVSNTFTGSVNLQRPDIGLLV